VPAEPARRRTLLLDQIIDAAGIVFAEKGIAGTSLQDVADHLGVSRAAIYYHVRGREHLVRLVIGGYIGLYREWLTDLRGRADLTPEQRLREAMRIITRPFSTHPHLSRIFLRGEMEMPDDVREEQRRSRRVIQHEVELILAEGVRDGSFAGIDPVVTTFAVFGMVNWMHVWFSPDGRLTAEEVADAFTDLVLHGIDRPPTANGAAADTIARMRELLDELERPAPPSRGRRKLSERSTRS
jgi:AcrR family transcriptional regulator